MWSERSSLIVIQELVEITQFEMNVCRNKEGFRSSTR